MGYTQILDYKNNAELDRASVQESDVRVALTRIVESADFPCSKSMGMFLRFVVEEELVGRGNRLKAFAIAREVYGRDETFDPRTDTIVRVGAGRLRQRLATYYATVGRNDPVRIDLPKGGYTPRFTRNEVIGSDAQPQTATLPTTPTTPIRPQSRNPLILTGALVLAMALVVAGWIIFMQDEPTSPSDSYVMLKAPGRFTTAFLAVLPLVSLADDPLEGRLAAALVEAIITDLTKLSGLSVMAHTSLLNLDSRSTVLSAIRREFGATHALRGSLERDDELVRVNIQLIDIVTNTTIWADRLDGSVRELMVLQDEMASRIVKHLLVKISAEEQARFGQSHSNNPEALVLYRQALILLAPPNLERIVTARHMFQRIIQIDPQFVGGYAGKSYTHTLTVLFSLSQESDIELQKSISLALKAIEVDPELGMGYVSLAFAYAMSGRKDEALSSASRAIAIQPGDAFTQFLFGLCLLVHGHAHEAVIPISEAIRLDPVEPRTPYRNVLGIVYFIMGEYSSAAELFEENHNFGGPTGPHMDIFHAATHAHLGEEQKARSIIRELVESHPDYLVEPFLNKVLPSRGEVSSMMDTLIQLGLPRK